MAALLAATDVGRVATSWHVAQMSSADERDPFNLRRFLDAQENSYAEARAELRRGAKRTHWMWYIFPQIASLGSSEMAQHFAIQSLEEARRYLEHPVLGARYVECVAALQDLTGTTAEQVFGPTDARKLRSSLTLFAAADDTPLLRAALARWFGSPDQSTLLLLGETGSQQPHD
jgi:uncharacterized protein (DUF1810 family)